MIGHELAREIIRLACTGMPSEAIAAKLNVGSDGVRSRLTRLRSAGLCPPVHVARAGGVDPAPWIAKIDARGRFYNRPPSLPRAKNTKNRVRTGTMGDLIACLGPDLAFKLGKEVPDGASLAEYIAAIVKDAVLEEME
jgi:hypothetical protein